MMAGNFALPGIRKICFMNIATAELTAVGRSAIGACPSTMYMMMYSTANTDHLFCVSVGRDVTTGLLLEAEPSPEVQGPLGALRRQLNQLQAPQADLGGYGRSDSNGPHTLKLLQAAGSTTQLLAPPAKPRGHRVSGERP